MESNGIAGGMFSNLGSGMLGLEMSLQHNHPHHLPHQNPQNPNQIQQHPHPSMVSFANPEQSSVKQSYPYAAAKPKTQMLGLTLSDDDDESCGADGKRKCSSSPWQRMKWTDGMVKLLIMVVFYVGDEAGSDGNDPAGKKKVATAAAGGALQKKGKWKSVSRAMLERGFYVSPQQCEDKFNDLNKRYKRVNDILGKGTACRVVENQSLLETMDLPAKTKEEVKKLLNSKHLFFREMCAYHHGGGGAAAAPNPSPEAHPQRQSNQETCLHSLEDAKSAKGGSGEEELDDEDDEYDDEDEDDDTAVDGGVGEEDETEDGTSRKKKKQRRGGETTTSGGSPLMQQLSSELMNLVQDGSKSWWEKRQWLRTRLMQLEEQRMSCHFRAFELEKKRFRWTMYSRKKEREMEKEKLENERLRLENERMVLLLKQKEVEVIDLQKQ